MDIMSLILGCYSELTGPMMYLIFRERAVLTRGMNLRKEAFWSAFLGLSLLHQGEACAYLTARVLLLIPLDVWSRGCCDHGRREFGWLFLFKG